MHPHLSRRDGAEDGRLARWGFWAHERFDPASGGWASEYRMSESNHRQFLSALAQLIAAKGWADLPNGAGAGGPGENNACVRDLIREVEQFLYREARLLDEAQFHDWLDALHRRCALFGWRRAPIAIRNHRRSIPEDPRSRS